MVSGGAGAISGPLRMHASVRFSASHVDGDIFPLSPFCFSFVHPYLPGHRSDRDVTSVGREELLLCSSALGHAHGQWGWPIRAALGGGEHN